MTSLGVWSCQWRELRPINFGGTASTTAVTAPSGTSDTGAAGGSTPATQDGLEGDIEQGFGRGSRRGRGRDGAGEYEMVGMKPEGTTS
jgi:hypothetical protein